ncbi:MAG: formyltransferase family protein [Bacillota bacterium]
MRVVLVTSQCMYVKDNYYSMIKKIADKNNLPHGTSICGVVFVKTVSFSLLLKALYLMVIGVRSLSLTLICNMISSIFLDRRKKLFKSLGVPVLLVDDINNPEVVMKIKNLCPDIIVNLRTRNIYKKEILQVPGIGCINIHHGLLPENRGTMCDLWAWYEGRPVGFSVHWMNEKIDDGHILKIKEIDISNIKKYTDIPMISSIYEAECLLECMDKISREGWFKTLDNKNEKVRFTRNPTMQEIRKMLKKGLKL